MTGVQTCALPICAKHGLQNAITRANLYVEAGANASLVDGPRSTYELAQICEHTKGYRAISISEGGITPLHTYQHLKEIGFHLVCILPMPNGCLHSCLHIMYLTLGRSILQISAVVGKLKQPVIRSFLQNMFGHTMPLHG